MNHSNLSTKDDADPAISIGVLALLATLLIASLSYLGSYSMGKEFMDRTPQLNRQVLAEGGVR